MPATQPGTPEAWQAEWERLQRMQELRNSLRSSPTGGQPEITDPRERYLAQQERQSLDTVKKSRPGGMANYYDDSWKVLLESLSKGESTDTAMEQILRQFQGKPDHMQTFLEQAAPFLGSIQARQMQGTDAFKYMQDQGNWDLGAMGAYGPAAGMIARGGAQGMKRAAGSLASSGLGRGTAMASMQQMGMQEQAGQQSNLFAQLHQRAAENRMRSAGSALDAHRLVAQMALGQSPAPRVDGYGGGGGGMPGMLSGIASGVGAGAAIGGPVGGIIGGLTFGGLTAAGQSGKVKV